MRRRKGTRRASDPDKGAGAEARRADVARRDVAAARQLIGAIGWLLCRGLGGAANAGRDRDTRFDRSRGRDRLRPSTSDGFAWKRGVRDPEL